MSWVDELDSAYHTATRRSRDWEDYDDLHKALVNAWPRIREVLRAAETVDMAHNPAGLEVELPERRGGGALSDALGDLSTALDAAKGESNA